MMYQIQYQNTTYFNLSLDKLKKHIGICRSHQYDYVVKDSEGYKRIAKFEGI